MEFLMYFIAGFTCVSAVFWAGSFVLTKRQIELFEKTYGPGRRPEGLTKTQLAEWEEIHDREFGRGFWKFVMVIYLIVHYPGLVVLSVILKRKTSYYPSMYVVSLVSWSAIAFAIVKVLDFFVAGEGRW